MLIGAVAHFIFLNTAIGFFFLHFLMRKIRVFFDDLTKSTLLAGGNPKSYGNFEILKFDRRTWSMDLSIGAIFRGKKLSSTKFSTRI